jgi:RNA polymerase sigma-70 factor (ECF subfamily)
VVDLCRRAAAGDRQAFGAWLERTHGVVFALAFRILGSQADAEDVVQDTYTLAWRNLGSLRDPTAHLGWVCSVARHVAIDRLRSRSRHPTQSLDAMTTDTSAPGGQPVDDRPSAEEVAITAQGRARVVEAMGRLKEKHRLVLVLRDVDGLAYQEIADALGLPVGTVESRLHRARAALALKLKTMFKHQGEAPP